jgi:hypothetical protein
MFFFACSLIFNTSGEHDKAIENLLHVNASFEANSL